MPEDRLFWDGNRTAAGTSVQVHGSSALGLDLQKKRRISILYESYSLIVKPKRKKRRVLGQSCFAVPNCGDDVKGLGVQEEGKYRIVGKLGKNISEGV